MKRWPAILAWGVALAAVAAVFAYLEATANFVDPDSFYHAQLATLMLGHGPAMAFPWLPLTTLAQHFADQAFLYHALLMPFVAIFGALVGTKVAAAAFATAAVAALAVCLRAWGGRHASWLAALVFTSGSLLFRLALPKAGALAVALWLVALTAFLGRRLWPLAALAFAAVWLHGSWPLVLVAAAANLAVAAALDRRTIPHAVRQAAAVAVGAVAGFVINPYFPANLAFAWEQIFQVAVVGYGSAVNIGQEWSPYGLGALLVENGGIWVALIITVCVGGYAKAADAWRAAPAEHRRTIFLAAVTIVLAAMTLRQRRHLEFLMPTLVLLLGAIWGWYARAIDAKAIWRDLASLVSRPRLAAYALAGYFVVVVWWLALAAVTGVRQLNSDPANAWIAPSGAAAYVAAHAAPGELVFHDNWSDFPKLFYYAPSVHGMAGLDPVFFYRRDSAAYARWRAMSEGQVARPAEAAFAEFGTRLFLVRTANRPLLAALRADPTVEPAYADIYFSVFRRRD